MTLENSLANYSFITLLASMIFYWVEISFAQLNLVLPKTNVARNLSIAGFDFRKAKIIGQRLMPASRAKQGDPSFEHEKYNGQNDVLENKSISSISSLAREADSSINQKFGFLHLNTLSFAKSGIILSNFLLGLLLLIRWKESGHFPLSNLYESLMFLSWCFTGLHLYIDNFAGEAQGTLFSQQEIRKILGSITIPSALLINAFATFTLPKEMQEASPLVPALQSNWLMMHVTVMILSYAALIIGSLMSIAFLVLTSIKNINVTSLDIRPKPVMIKKYDEANSLNIRPNLANEAISSSTQMVNTKNITYETNRITLQKSDLLLVLDNLSYRILGIGFPLLTIGILSGAVWANEAWGSYWSWDPKETWALLTWLVFAIYLHTRISKGWAGKKPAIIASFGFLIVWMCYLGVNLIGEGLHSYGWIINV